jgi:hypothetical protein
MRAIAARASRIVEIGPGRPLSGFFKDVGVAVRAVTEVAALREAVEDTAREKGS